MNESICMLGYLKDEYACVEPQGMANISNYSSNSPDEVLPIFSNVVRIRITLP